MTLLIGAYSSKKLTVVYLEASKSADVEKNNFCSSMDTAYFAKISQSFSSLYMYNMVQYVQISVRRGYDIAVGQFGNGANGPLGRNNCLLE